MGLERLYSVPRAGPINLAPTGLSLVALLPLLPIGKPLRVAASGGTACSVLVNKAPHAAPPCRSETDSVADWSIWDAEEASEGHSSDFGPEASAPAPAAAGASAGPASLLPPVATPAPPRHLRPRVPHPAPVTAERVAVPIPVLARAPAGASAAVPRAADVGGGAPGGVVVAGEGAEVAPAAVGAAGADKGDAAVLAQAGASLAGGHPVWRRTALALQQLLVCSILRPGLPICTLRPHLPPNACLPGAVAQQGPGAPAWHSMRTHCAALHRLPWAPM